MEGREDREPVDATWESVEIVPAVEGVALLLDGCGPAAAGLKGAWGWKLEGGEIYGCFKV